MRTEAAKRKISARSRKVQKLAVKFVRATADFFEKTPERWAKHANAYDKTGKRIGYRKRDAHCFCMHGRLRREFERGTLREPTLRSDVWQIITTCLYAAISTKKHTHMSTYNDRKGRTVAQVVDKLRQAETRIERFFD